MPGHTHRFGIEDSTRPRSAPGRSRSRADRLAPRMKRLKHLFFPLTVLISVAVPYAARGFQSTQLDANYHKTDASKISTPAKVPERVANQVSYPKSALTTIEIL